MKTFKSLLSLLGAIVCLIVAFGTMRGWVHNYIMFESTNSEMGFTLMMASLAVILVASVDFPIKK